MPLRHCQFWIFDMDGTLTIPIHDFEEIRSALDIAPGTPILEAIKGMPEDQARAVNQKLHDLEMELAIRSVVSKRCLCGAKAFK